MLKDLIKLANHLDQKGLTKEANSLDVIIRKLAQTESFQLTHINDINVENKSFFSDKTLMSKIPMSGILTLKLKDGSGKELEAKVDLDNILGNMGNLDNIIKFNTEPSPAAMNFVKEQVSTIWNFKLAPLPGPQ